MTRVLRHAGVVPTQTESSLWAWPGDSHSVQSAGTWREEIIPVLIKKPHEPSPQGPMRRVASWSARFIYRESMLYQVDA